MPIYRGATKITPVRGGTALSRVYRGATLVWEAKTTPVKLGAVSWLDFTNGVQDIGLQPQTAILSVGAVANGYGHEPTIYMQRMKPFDLGGDFGFSMWRHARNTTAETAAPAVWLYDSNNYEIALFARQSNGDAKIRFRHGDNPAQSRTISLPGGWHHIAAFLEKASGTTFRATCYVDGVQVLNFTFNAGTQTPVSSVGPYFYHYGGVADRESDVDDIAIYLRALTHSEVTGLHSAGRSS